jgi:hypothetical protein
MVWTVTAMAQHGEPSLITTTRIRPTNYKELVHRTRQDLGALPFRSPLMSPLFSIPVERQRPARLSPQRVTVAHGICGLSLIALPITSPRPICEITWNNLPGNSVLADQAPSRRAPAARSRLSCSSAAE